jgi:hypothetical protein
LIEASPTNDDDPASSLFLSFNSSATRFLT